MPSVNTVASRHSGPSPIAGWSWLPFNEKRHLHKLRTAVRIIDSRIRGSRPCGAAFRALPLERTFAQVWADANIWISYDPKNDGQNYGATNFVGGKEVTISEYALRMGHWTTAATLIHELAHTNGADGTSHDAEATLRDCLLSGLEDPTIIGMFRHIRSGTMTA